MTSVDYSRFNDIVDSDEENEPTPAAADAMRTPPPEELRAQAAQMRADPAAIRRSVPQMANLTDEEIRAAAANLEQMAGDAALTPVAPKTFVVRDENEVDSDDDSDYDNDEAASSRPPAAPAPPAAAAPTPPAAAAPAAKKPNKPAPPAAKKANDDSLKTTVSRAGGSLLGELGLGDDALPEALSGASLGFANDSLRSRTRAPSAPPVVPKGPSIQVLGCANCGRGREGDLRACARCGGARYCSKECQRADWKVHKRACASRPPTEQEQAAAAMRALADPEIQDILKDPEMQSVLNDLRAGSQEAAARSMADPVLRMKMEKLVNAGVLTQGTK